MHNLACQINATLRFHGELEKAVQKDIDVSDPAWVKREDDISFKEAAKALKSRQISRSVYNAFFAVTQYLDLERRFTGERELSTSLYRVFSKNPNSRFDAICQGKMKMVDSGQYNRRSCTLPGIETISSSRYNLSHSFYVSDEDFEYQALRDIQETALHFCKNLEAESIIKAIRTYINFLNTIKRITDRKITVEDLIKWYGDGNFDTFVDKIKNFTLEEPEEVKERPDFLPSSDVASDVMKVKLRCQIRLKKPASVALPSA